MEYRITSIKLREELWQAMKVYAAEHNTTMKDIIDQAVSHYLNEHTWRED